MNQAQLFDSTICLPTAVLYLECTESIQQERLLHRASTADRFDDNLEVIKKWFRMFSGTTLPVFEYYNKQGKVRRIDASKEEADVYQSIEVALQDLIEALRQPGSGFPSAV